MSQRFWHSASLQAVSLICSSIPGFDSMRNLDGQLNAGLAILFTTITSGDDGDVSPPEGWFHFGLRIYCLKYVFQCLASQSMMRLSNLFGELPFSVWFVSLSLAGITLWQSLLLLFVDAQYLV